MIISSVLADSSSSNSNSYSNYPTNNNHSNNNVDLNVPVTLSMNYQRSEEPDKQTSSHSKIPMDKIDEEDILSPNG